MKAIKAQIFQSGGEYTAECEGEHGRGKTIGPEADFAKFWKALRTHMKKIHDAD